MRHGMAVHQTGVPAVEDRLKGVTPSHSGLWGWHHPAYDEAGDSYDADTYSTYSPRQICAHCTRAWHIGPPERALQGQMAWYDNTYEPRHCLLSGLRHASPLINHDNICHAHIVITSLLRTSQSLVSLRIVPPTMWDTGNAHLSRPLFDIVPSSLRHLCFHGMLKRDWLDFPKKVFLHSLDTNQITADTLQICGQLQSIHVHRPCQQIWSTPSLQQLQGWSASASGSRHCHIHGLSCLCSPGEAVPEYQ